MSESASDVAYLTVVLIGCCSAAVKLSALRRGFSVSLVTILSCQLAGVCAFLMATPVVYRTFDALTGWPGLATLVVYVCIIVFAAHAHLLAVVWAAEVTGRPVTRIRAVVPAVCYLLLLAAMAATFCRARLTGPEHPLDFNTAHAHDPAIVAFLTVFMAGLSYSMLSAAWECRQGSRTGNERLRQGLRDISVASLFIFGYVVFAAPALIGAATGRPGLDVLTEAGSLSGTVGAFILNWGFSGPVVVVWWRDRGDYRRLRVLWETAVEGAGRSVALAPPSRLVERWSLLSAGAWLLLRRIADICDAERALAPWMEPALARAVEDAAPGTLPAEERRALVSAALLLDAVRRRRSGEPPAAGAHRPQEVAPQSARGHLVRVAGALNHPVVRAALSRRGAPAPG